MLGGAFYYTFAENQNVFMGVFLAILIMMTTISVGIFLVVKIVKNEYPSTEKVRIALLHFVAVTLMLLPNILCGDESLVLRLPFDMLVALFPMLIVVSSVWEEQSANKLSSFLTMFVWISYTGVCWSVFRPLSCQFYISVRSCFHTYLPCVPVCDISSFAGNP